MAIKTRQDDSDVSTDKAVQKITELLKDFSGGTLGNHPNARVQLGTDLDSILADLEMMLEVQHGIAQSLYNDVMILGHDNLAQALKLAQAMELLDSMMTVPYDDPLDQATLDMMDAFTSSGDADIDANGDLVFDQRISFSKSDLKPVLREAITRWVDLKIR